LYIEPPLRKKRDHNPLPAARTLTRRGALFAASDAARTARSTFPVAVKGQGTTSCAGNLDSLAVKERMIIVFDDESQEFDVVMNAEEQYSIWPAGRELPAGWRLAGFRGLKSDCLAHIDTVWTEITPLSARLSASNT
jgi:MbtH protein